VWFQRYLHSVFKQVKKRIDQGIISLITLIASIVMYEEMYEGTKRGSRVDRNGRVKESWKNPM
jgi:hypothetical protein